MNSDSLSNSELTQLVESNARAIQANSQLLSALGQIVVFHEATINDIAEQHSATDNRLDRLEMLVMTFVDQVAGEREQNGSRHTENERMIAELKATGERLERILVRLVAGQN